MDEIVLLRFEKCPDLYALNRSDYPWSTRPQVTNKLLIEMEDSKHDGFYEVYKVRRGNMLELLPKFDGKENKKALAEKQGYLLDLKKINIPSRKEAVRPYKIS